MAIEHNVITDPNRHEPKDIATATPGQTYLATGGGVDGGSWGDILPVGTDTATVGQTFIADGAGTGNWKDGGNFVGEMIVVNNTSAFAVPAAVDPTLATDSDYVKITLGGLWQAGVLQGVTFDVDKLVAPTTGLYRLDFWASVQVSNTNTLVGIKFAIDDTPPFSSRKVLFQSNSANNVGTVAGAGLILPLTINQSISLYIAADAATNVTGKEAGLILSLVQET